MSSNLFSGIYQRFIIHMFVMFYGVHTLSAEIKGKLTGINGGNGTEIECSYTKHNVKSTISISFIAFNKSNSKFNEIALYIPDDESYLTNNGQYLKGRVTLMNITQSTTKAVMTFNELMCIDDTLYQCKAIHLSSNGAEIITSNNGSISVQVAPSKPDHVSIVHTPAYFAPTSSKNMLYRSSLQPTGVTTTSTMQSEIQNKKTTFNDSISPEIVYHTTSIPYHDDFSSDIRYRTTTDSKQHTTTERVIAEGDNITVICAGDVGKPPAEYVFEKNLKGQIIPIQYTVITTSISELSKNCSFYRTSHITFEVTPEDNNVVIRCGVNSSMADPDMFVEKEPIEVYYPVRMPTIINYPHKTEYVVGEDTSIRLACKSDGNPKPSYIWYKENPKEQVSANENFTITNMNTTNSGNYTCEVSNIFLGNTYLKAAIVNIKIINAEDKLTPSTSGSWLNTAKDVTVIAIVFVIGLIVFGVVGVILYRRTRKKEDYESVDRMESNLDQIESQMIPTRGVLPSSSTKKSSGYEDVDLDDTARKFKPVIDEETIAKVKQHNEEYLKKLKEDEEREKNNPTQPPEAAVYACVNKPKNTTTTENKPSADQQEENVYEDSKEGLYDTSGDRRHKDSISAEHFDSTENLKNEESDQKDVITGQKSHIGGYINKAYENSENKEEKRQVATVSPTVQLWYSSQGEGQKSKSDEIQPKTEKQTTHETSL